MTAQTPVQTPAMLASLDDQLRMRAPDSPLRKALRRFRRHRLAMAGLLIISTLVIAALLGSQRAALGQNLKAMNKAPSADHLFGTDRIGRDILARTLVGGQPGYHLACEHD